MRRFLVWAAVLATALLVSATDPTVAKPIARKRDSKPRGWVLAGDLADDEELAGQQHSSGYLRWSETAATSAYNDKTSVATTEKASTSYTAKPSPPSSASYGEKTTVGATTTAPPTTTSAGAVKQGLGVSSVIVPWDSVTAKASAYSNTEAPTPPPKRTEMTGGGLYGAGAPTSAEKATAWYNAKTKKPSPSASYVEKTTAALMTPPPPTAPPSEKTSTSPYSATDTLKQGEVVSSVIAPWGSVISNTATYSSTEGPTPTERIERNGDDGARVVKSHDAIPATDSKGEAKQSDSNVHESPAEDKASDSKFGLPQWSPPVSGVVEKTAPENDKHGQTTDKSDSTADKRGSGHSDSWVSWQASTDKRGRSTSAQRGDPLYSTKSSSQYDHKVASPLEDKAVLPDTSDVVYREKTSPLSSKVTTPRDEKSWSPASEVNSDSYSSKAREAATSVPYVSPSGEKHENVASAIGEEAASKARDNTTSEVTASILEDRKHIVDSIPDIDKSHEAWGHDSAQPRSSDDDKTGQLRGYVPPQSSEAVHPRFSPGSSASLDGETSFKHDEKGTTTQSETVISTNTGGSEASYTRNHSDGEHPSISDRGKVTSRDGVKQTADTSATEHADNENDGSRSAFGSGAPTPRPSKHYKDDEGDKNGGNGDDDNYAKSVGVRGLEKRTSWAKSTDSDSEFHESTAPAPPESTMTYNSEVDSPAGEKTRSTFSENQHTSEHNKRGDKEPLSYRETSSSSGGGDKHEGRVEEFTVPWRNEASSSPGFSSNHAPTSETKKQSDGTEHDAATETTNSEPVHNSPVYDGVLGRVVPWNDGKPELVIVTTTEKPTPYPVHAEADAYPEEQTESRDYGHLLGDLTPWRESHSLLQRELQAEDNEQPTEQPATEVTSDEPQEVPVDKTADQTDDKTVDQSAEEKSAEQQEDTSTEQPANQPTETSAEQQEDTSAEQPADQPTETSTEQPADQPAETSAEQPSEHAETLDDGEVMKTTAVVDENVRWNQDDCNPCDVPTQPPTSAPLYPRKDDDYEQQLPNVTEEYKSWDHVKEEPEPASTKPPKKKKAYKPPKADLIRCTKVIGEYGESYECENESTQPPSETPYEPTPSPETPTQPPQETPATTTTEPPSETPYEPTSTPQPSEPATTTPPTETTPAPTKPSEPTPAPTKPGEPTPAPTKPSEPTPAPTKPGEPTPAPSKPSEPTPAPSKPGEATPAPTKAYDDSKSTPVSTSKGTSTFPTGTKATTSKTATPVATAGPSTPTETSVDTSAGNTAYGTSGTTGGSNDNVVGASTSEGNTSSGSSDALSGGAIAGIVIACVVFAAVVVGAVLYRQRSIARQREENLFADLAAGGAGRALETDYAAM